MKMRKLLALGLGIVFAIGAVAGCGNQAAEKPAKETKAIVVGLDDNYPPMGFKNENNEVIPSKIIVETTNRGKIVIYKKEE